MREYACQCLLASATGTLKTSGTSQTRALQSTRRTHHMLFADKKEGTQGSFETAVPAIL